MAQKDEMESDLSLDVHINLQRSPRQTLNSTCLRPNTSQMQHSLLWCVLQQEYHSGRINMLVLCLNIGRDTAEEL